MGFSRTIQLAKKIINEGDVGVVDNIEGNMLQVKLNNNVQAFDGNWKQLVAPGNNVIMFFDENKDVKLGDNVIITKEDLCTARNKTSLKCDIILCNL